MSGSWFTWHIFRNCTLPWFLVRFLPMLISAQCTEQLPSFSRSRGSMPPPPLDRMYNSPSSSLVDPDSYLRTLEEKFPGAMPENAFIRQATEVLLGHGFNPSNSINLVSTCRDEICRPFSQELDRLWGPSFSISSLAGMVFCGRSGFKAAMAHSPVRSGRERYIFWVMSHIALSRSFSFRFATKTDCMPFLQSEPRALRCAASSEHCNTIM